MLGPSVKHDCKPRNRQVNGGELPPHVLPFCAVGGAAAAVVAIAAFLLQRASQRMSEAQAIEISVNIPESAARWRTRRAAAVAAAEWAIPSGIGVAVGMYVAAEWTLPRVIGCLAEQVCRRPPCVLSGGFMAFSRRMCGPPLMNGCSFTLSGMCLAWRALIMLISKGLAWRIAGRWLVWPAAVEVMPDQA